MSLLAGRTGIVFGVANKRSIAWAIAQAWYKAGAKLAFTYQGDRVKENVEELAGTFGADTLRRAVEALHDRLARVTIECLDYQEFIRRYDGPGALFYLDPPYYLCEDYYGKGLFSRDDFEHLADLLGGIKGRWLMSINDHPEVRRLFARFRIDEEPVAYRVGGVVKPVVELVIGGGG